MGENLCSMKQDVLALTSDIARNNEVVRLVPATDQPVDRYVVSVRLRTTNQGTHKLTMFLVLQQMDRSHGTTDALLR